MFAPRLLPLVLAALGFFPTTALTSEIAVRVYDTTGQPAAEQQAALEAAAAILTATSVAVRWHRCDGAGRSSVCDIPMLKGDLALRIVRSSVVPRERRDLPLGDAFLDRKTGAGVLATVYADRVATLAEETGVDRRVVLGRAIAHELGHLLLASHAHGPRGLMRAVWSRDELRRDRGADWSFAPAEAAVIRDRARRGSETAWGTQ